MHAKQHAGGSGHALAALEAEKHREQMPQKSGQPDGGQCAVAQAVGSALPLHQRHRQPALDGVQQQRGNGGKLVARAQHVGSARVFAAVAARIVQAHEAADDHRERERADQVGGQHRSGKNKLWRKVLQVELRCRLNSRVAQLPAHRVNRFKQIGRQYGAQSVDVFVQLG